MPLYNEEPARAAAALDAMASDLVARGASGHFDLFILSDTTDGDIALAEEEAVWALRRRLSEGPSIYYRRRERNTAHKSGNIREFCERWGRAYDHFLVLDADSLMEGATIIELVRRMENDPDAGLIQTVPRLHEGTTLVARLQQFAARVYGPVLASGLAWWTGREGNFWGHNALIRTRAFMESCGLPELPGRPPLGGPILSHDFVEAALLRRAGWSVRIADDLHGLVRSLPSHAGRPCHPRPSLVPGEPATRPRAARERFALGQPLPPRVRDLVFRFVADMAAVPARGARARGAKRVCAARIFHALVQLVSGVAAPRSRARASHVHPEPRDPRRSQGPRGAGLCSAQPQAAKRLSAGGGLLLPFSVALELVLSALLAPILMLIHCGLVASILAGRDSGWRPQRRGDQSLPWTEVAYRHRWHVVAGIALAAVGLLDLLANGRLALAGRGRNGGGGAAVAVDRFLAGRPLAAAVAALA